MIRQSRNQAKKIPLSFKYIIFLYCSFLAFLSRSALILTCELVKRRTFIEVSPVKRKLLARASNPVNIAMKTRRGFPTSWHSVEITSPLASQILFTESHYLDDFIGFKVA